MTTPSAQGASPAMAQWFALKAEHPDALLFFRMGDFYEMFFDDAAAASSALDIALTHRGEQAGQPIPMCGVPVVTADIYLARLIRRGFRVAVAEQMEAASARAGKAPLRREVVRLITPGTLTEESLLDAARPNLLLALSGGAGRVGAAWLDVSTGLFETSALDEAGLAALLGRLDPAEILAPDAMGLGDFASRRAPAMAPQGAAAARRRLAEAFGAASLDAFGSFTDEEAIAGGLALDYLKLTQAGRMPRLAPPMPVGDAGQMAMDAATRASLEILAARDGGTQLSLLASASRTLSAPGTRLLAGWLAAPLTDARAIGARQDGWVFLNTEPALLASLRARLRGVADMARALARLCLGRGSPRDLAAIRLGLTVARACGASLPGAAPALLIQARAALAGAPELAALLGRALAETPPVRLEDGGVIAPGYDGELDAERALRDDSRRVISAMQLDFAQEFGVASLKIRHHAQLGYVIEVPAAAVEGLRGRADLVLRQGMANGARFTHARLSDLDRRISEAHERAQARERAVFATLVQATRDQAEAIAAAAAALATLDVLQSCASLAEGGDWCRPVLSDTDDFEIQAGRHPVVQAAIAGQAGFVPNDCDLSPDRRLLLLTGPNMAGKSTYLRQNALIAILAQAGLPAPAAAVRIGIIDRLFSRVGAADELARGRSTFMVEMIETAAILHQAGPRSLVIVDEIGRGTATLDGLAIAWAVLEALHSQIRCRTIFATHFHELARLTGVPGGVVKRAATLLAALERDRAPVIADLPLFATLPAEVPDRLASVFAQIDPDKLTAREALDLIYRIKQEV